MAQKLIEDLRLNYPTNAIVCLEESVRISFFNIFYFFKNNLYGVCSLSPHYLCFFFIKTVI